MEDIFSKMTIDNVIDIATFLVTLAAGVWAVFKWRGDKNVERASRLGNLRKRFYSFKPDVILQKMMSDNSCAHGDKNRSEAEKDDENHRKEFFSFLAHLCYLNERGVLPDKEFNVFKWQIIRFLEQSCVYDALESIYVPVNIRQDLDKPFYSLIKFGANSCDSKYSRRYQELIDNECADNTEKKVVIGQSYRTHLDVLNGIFNLGYLAHMRGLAVLPNGDGVWFPLMEIDGNIPVATQRKRWYNVLNDAGDEIVEYSPDMQDAWKLDCGKRYVFGKYKTDKDVEYRFVGVFVPDHIDETEQLRIYKRVGNRIEIEEVRK